METALIEETIRTFNINDTPVNPEKMANGVVHQVTKETITKHRQLHFDPITRLIWPRATCKKLGCLTQEYGESGSTYHTKGTNTMRFLDLGGIKTPPATEL